MAEMVTAQLLKYGIVATTSPGGSGAAKNADWSFLSGRRSVFICPDNDEPGMKYAQTVCRKIAQLFFPPEVMLCEIPEIKKLGIGADLADLEEVKNNCLSEETILLNSRPFYAEEPKAPCNYSHHSRSTLFFDNPHLNVFRVYSSELECQTIQKDGWQVLNCLCPFHSDSKPGSFAINNNGAFKCFSCGLGGGGLIKFIMLRLRCSGKEALEYLANHY